MTRLIVFLFLLINLSIPNRLLAQEPIDCEEFHKEVVLAFINSKPIDSILNTVDSRLLELYNDLEDDEMKSILQFRHLMEIDEYKEEYKHYLSSYFEGQRLPELKSKTINKKKVSLPEYGKITVLNIWFTRCKPCIKELPDLNTLQKEFGNKNVAFTSIARDPKERIEHFLEKHPFHYDIISDQKQKLLDKLCIQNFPTNIITNADGEIVYYSIGVADLEKMKSILLDLIKVNAKINH